MIKKLPKRTKILLGVLAAVILLAPPLSYAVSPAIRVNGVQVASQGATPCAAGSGCLWWDGNVNGPVWHKADNTNITIGAAGAGYATVDQAATPLTQRTILNFTGAGVSCVDNAGATRTDCTVSGSGSGTVTNITMGTGLSSTQSPLTTTGTMSVLYGTSSTTATVGNDARLNGLYGIYGGAAAASNNVVLETSTLGTPTFRDNATPLANGTLLVTDSTGTKTLLQVAPTGYNITGPFNFAAAKPSWFFMQNSTAATVGVPSQMAPDIVFSGTAWDGAASRAIGFRLWNNSGTTGSTSYTSDLRLTPSRVGVDRPDLLVLSDNGTTQSATFSGQVIAPTLGPSSSQQHTVPAVASDTLAVLAAGQTFSGADTFSGVVTHSSGWVWRRRTVTADTTLLATDFILEVNKASAAAITLPAGVAGAVYWIKDTSGAAATNNITVSGAVNIDGTATKVIAVNYGWLAVEYDATGSQWRVIDQNLTAASGGSTVGLKGAYNGGVTSADNIIPLTSTLGPALVRDNATPLGATATLFGVQTNGGTKIFDVTQSTATINQQVQTTGSPSALAVFGAAHTTLTAGAEATDVGLSLARTVQFATGAITTQRAAWVSPPTYSFVAASTITNAATFAVTGAPVAGTNATITNDYSLWVQAGRVEIDQAAVGVAQTVGLGFNNSTAATSGAANQQWSPAITLLGQQYNGSSSVTTGWLIQSRPITAQTNAGDLVFFGNYNNVLTEYLSVRTGSNSTIVGGQGGGASSQLVLSDSAGTTIRYGTTQMGIAVAVTGFNFTVSGTDTMHIIANELTPTSDNVVTNGDSTHRYTKTWSYQHNGVQPSDVANAATVTITVANGETQRVLAGATAMTINGTAGNAGEKIAVCVVEDATGTRTASFGTGANNFALAGSAWTFTPTASKRDCFWFAWDTADTIWRETGRALNQSTTGT